MWNGDLPTETARVYPMLLPPSNTKLSKFGSHWPSTATAPSTGCRYFAKCETVTPPNRPRLSTPLLPPLPLLLRSAITDCYSKTNCHRGCQYRTRLAVATKPHLLPPRTLITVSQTSFTDFLNFVVYKDSIGRWFVYFLVKISLFGLAATILFYWHLIWMWPGKSHFQKIIALSA